MTTPYTASDFNVTDNDSTLNVGDLRRGYAFTSSKLATLNVAQDRLFHILATMRNEPTPDSQFKITEERPFHWRRYGFVTGWKTWSGSGSVPVTGYTEDSSDISSLAPQTQGSYMAFKVGTDYKSEGNVGNVFGQSNNEITIGDNGTCPIFFTKNQIVKICTSSAVTDKLPDDYFTAKILDVQTSGNYAYIGVEVVRPLTAAANKHLCSFVAADTPISETYTYAHGTTVGDTKKILDGMKITVVGNAYAPGSGLPDYYNDQPFSTRYGYTMILKCAYGMDNTARATEYKIVKNEFERNWTRTLMAFKWDIAQEIYFSSLYRESDGTQHTQGIVDWAINYGNVFSMDSTKSEDDFLEDFSTLLDPRFNPISNYLFVVPTYWFNFFFKLGSGGYHYNTLMLGNATDNRGALYGINFAGKARIGNAQIFQYSTYHGTINVMEDIHLNGTPIKMLAIPMNNIKYRPLKGNGIDRDVYIIEGIQTLEKTGIDAFVNHGIVEFGIETTLPETWGIWL